MRKNLLLFSSVLVIVVGHWAAPASASCAAPEPLAARLARADSVFVGTVIETGARDRVATVRVEERWKGPDLPPRVEVRGSEALQDNAATSVDRTFRAGTRYLFVPTAAGGGVFRDNACSATQPYEPTLEAFRPASWSPVGAGPDDAPAPDAAGSDRAVMVAVALAAAALVLGGGTLAWRRRAGGRAGSQPASPVQSSGLSST